MKTSNIILLTFFLVLFTIPFLVSVAISNKIGKGQYTRIVNQRLEHERKLMTGEFNIIVLKGHSEWFGCVIVKDDSSYIEYANYNNDSLVFKRNGDTLTVMYTPLDSSKHKNQEDQFNFTIHTTSLSNIIAEKTSVNLIADPYFTTHAVKVSLTNEASFTLFNKEGWTDEHNGNEETLVENPQIRRDSGAQIMFDRMDIISSSSMVHLVNNAFVNALHIQADDKSKLLISPSFKYGSMSATISDSTEITGPWHALRNLRNLNK